MSYRPSLFVLSTISSLGMIAAPQSAIVAQAAENACYPGMKLAQEAVKEGEVATTAQEWNQIAQKWQSAADLLAQVSPEEACYAENPQRVESYRNNSQIALEEAQKSPSVAQPILSLGAEEPAVNQLQEDLKDLGYFKDEVNGIYGDTTLEAVIAFQSAQGLTADGEVGQNTWDKLKSAKIIQSASSAQATNESETKPKKKPSARQGLIGWVMMGLGGLTVLGGTIFVLLKLLNKNGENEEFEEDEEDEKPENEVNLDANIDIPSSSSLVSAPVEESINGKAANSQSASESFSLANSNSLEKKQAELEPEDGENSSEDIKKPGEILPVNETSRLPKLSIVDDLIHQLQSSEAQQRRQAIWELGQQGNSLAVQPLLNVLLDCDSGERTLVLSALSEIGVKTIKPMNRALSLSLQDENPEVRKNAIRDFTRMYELIATVSHMMCHAVDDPDREVQEVAEWSVRQLRRISAASNLVQLKEEKSPRLSDDFLDDRD